MRCVEVAREVSRSAPAIGSSERSRKRGAEWQKKGGRAEEKLTMEANRCLGTSRAERMGQVWREAEAGLMSQPGACESSMGGGGEGDGMVGLCTNASGTEQISKKLVKSGGQSSLHRTVPRQLTRSWRRGPALQTGVGGAVGGREGSTLGYRLHWMRDRACSIQGASPSLPLCIHHPLTLMLPRAMTDCRFRAESLSCRPLCEV